MNQFPNLHQAVLDRETLEALFRDIAALGANVEVTLKGRARQPIVGPPTRLVDAQADLIRGAIQAVQLRYDHQRDRWCDTLMPTEGAWRLTRINLAEAASLVAE